MDGALRNQGSVNDNNVERDIDEVAVEIIAENAGADNRDEKIQTICIGTEFIVKKGEDGAHERSITSVNIHEKRFKWIFAMATWNRESGNDSGRVQFIFTFTLLSTAYEFQDIADAVVDN